MIEVTSWRYNVVAVPRFFLFFIFFFFFFFFFFLFCEIHRVVPNFLFVPSLCLSVRLVGFLNRYFCPSLSRILSRTIFKGNAISRDENETFDVLPPLIDHLAALISSLTNPFLRSTLFDQLARDIPSYLSNSLNA